MLTTLAQVSTHACRIIDVGRLRLCLGDVVLDHLIQLVESSPFSYNFTFVRLPVCVFVGDLLGYS